MRCVSPDDQRLQVLGQLASGVAHDFANLLTAVIGASDAALARPSLDGATAEDLRRIRADAQRGTALVRQILSFGRPVAAPPDAVPVVEAVRDTARWLQRLLPPRIELAVDTPDAGPDVLMSRAELDQVIANLVLNGRDAIEGDGRIAIQLHAMPEGNHVSLSVTDSGSGMAPALLPQIFEPFFSTRLGRGGNGIGLSTVRDILNRAGGTVRVTSAPGEGSRFTVTLPARPAPCAGRTARTVLFVDDEPSLLRVAVSRLSAAGWRALTAEDADAALEQANDAPPDLVIADMTLPGCSGLRLIETLRRRWPGLPAILTSGYAAESLRPALDGQAICFVPKPYTFDTLLRRAREFLAAPDLCS